MIPATDHPQPVYICAPYAAPTWAERYAHIGRVRLLANALTRLGYAVVEVHTLLDGADDSDPPPVPVPVLGCGRHGPGRHPVG